MVAEQELNYRRLYPRSASQSNAHNLVPAEFPFLRAEMYRLCLSTQEGLHFLWQAAEVASSGLFIGASSSIALPVD